MFDKQSNTLINAKKCVWKVEHVQGYFIFRLCTGKMTLIKVFSTVCPNGGALIWCSTILLRQI